MKKSDLDLFFKIQKSLEKIEQQNQGDILRTYARALRDINKKVKDIYIRYAKDGVLSNTDKTVLNQMASIEKQAASILGKRHSEVENMINQRARLSYGESFFKHAYFIDKTANLNLDWGTIPTNAVEFAFNNDYELLVKGQTFKKALNSSLTKVQDVFSTALIEGKSYQEVARNLVKVLGVEAVGFDAARYVGHGVSSWALMTSRTELHRAVVQGQQKTFETAKENGIDVKQVWCATLDGRTRLEHGHLDGQYKDEKEDGWWVPELSAFVKGPNQSGFPSFDINCRCCVRPEVLGLKPEERYIRDEGITKYKTYDEWVNKNINSSSNPKLQKKFESKKGFTNEDIKSIRDDSFKTAPPYMQEAVEKVETANPRNPSKYEINNNIKYSAQYSFINNTISYRIDELKRGFISSIRTMQHETGHKLDFYNIIMRNGKGLLSQDPRFIKIIEDTNDRFFMMNGELSKNGKRWLSFIRKNTNTSSPQYKSFSDLLGSISNKKIIGAWSHPDDYIIGNNQNRYKEVFADIVDIIAHGKVELKQLNKLNPNLVRIVETLIKENIL